jgi:hypothetical protein
MAESLPIGATYERRKPQRSASLESDALVPAIQAGLSALVASIAGGATSAVLDVWRPWPAAGVCGVGALAISWLVLLRDHRGLLWDIERVTGADLDGDGHVGQRIQVKPDVTRVEVTEHRRNQTRVRYCDVPLSDPELERLAAGVLQRGVSFSRRSLADAEILEAERYSDVKDAMMGGGLLRYRGNGKHSGLELSPAGRAFLRQYLRA